MQYPGLLDWVLVLEHVLSPWLLLRLTNVLDYADNNDVDNIGWSTGDTWNEGAVTIMVFITLVWNCSLTVLTRVCISAEDLNNFKELSANRAGVKESDVELDRYTSIAFFSTNGVDP